MNLAQMRTALKDILSSSGANQAIGEDDFWADAELNTLINAAQDEVYKIIRRARSDYFVRHIKSTDAATIIRGRSFDPSTLRIMPGIGEYTLPNDFVRIKYIGPLQSDFAIRFTAADIAKSQFKALWNKSNISTSGEYLYDVIGRRSLVVRPVPSVEFDIEIIYEKLLDRLRDWAAGTISIDNGAVIALFSDGAQIDKVGQVGDEIIIGTQAALPTVDPTLTYPVIKSVDSQTQVTLESPYYF